MVLDLNNRFPLQSKAAKKKSSKKRSGSEAAQFDQKTIQEFKEAFGIMDQDKDGVITKASYLILSFPSLLLVLKKRHVEPIKEVRERIRSFFNPNHHLVCSSTVITQTFDSESVVDHEHRLPSTLCSRT